MIHGPRGHIIHNKNLRILYIERRITGTIVSENILVKNEKNA